MRLRTVAIASAAVLLVVAAIWLLTRPKSPAPAPAATTAPAAALTTEPSPVANPTIAAAAVTPTLPALPTGTQPAFVSPISPIPYAHRGIPLDSGRSAPAMTWYDMADEAARAWHTEALFLGIAPSFIMERNLPFLPSKAGWFYRFGRAGDALEFYVQVADGAISGSTEAEAIGERETPTPLDTASIALDSDEARAIYLATTEGQSATDAALDYTLAFDAAVGGPVWWIWDVSISDEAPVLAIDATSGDVVPTE